MVIKKWITDQWVLQGIDVAIADIVASGTPGSGNYLRGDGMWATVPAGYTLPLAANGTRGGVQIGYSETGENYAVKLASEKMYVTVPDYSLPLASTVRGGVNIGYTSSGLNRAVALSSEKMYVALPKATGSQYGVSKISWSGGVLTIDVT